MSDTFYPSMAAHCHTLPANFVSENTLSQQQQHHQLKQSVSAAEPNSMAVSFERKYVPKRGRGSDDAEAATGNESGRCTYYRNSVVAISAKRTKAIESQT
ncbi:hypothetical protein H4R20_000236 [Coemansia guatemalensis]|uniref:Uncharacterized protein n=1 Tax=Coemansia guatemalensis TaxID=2761395 RepID=A0A9W8I478_9FUNG|nr:hypothetical protein H4R20_000236 [Coemansia guatemalensis]